MNHKKNGHCSALLHEHNTCDHERAGCMQEETGRCLSTTANKQQTIAQMVEIRDASYIELYDVSRNGVRV